MADTGRSPSKRPDPLAGVVSEELAATLSALSAAQEGLRGSVTAGVLVELSLVAAERTDVALAFAAIVESDDRRREGWEALRTTVAREADRVVDAVPC